MIEVIKSGPFVTVQDLGRFHFRSVGVGTAGAMDPLALRTGNILLGNDDNAAGLEITASGLQVVFTRESAIAITGAHGKPTLSGLELPPNWAINVRPGDELIIHPVQTGMRTYLCVSGGIDEPLVLGSRSTDVKSGFGGLQGRSLAKGDVLKTHAVSLPTLPTNGMGAFLDNGMLEADDGLVWLNVIPAAETNLLDTLSMRLLWESEWTVGRDSNRMGLRLEGPKLALKEPVELLSHPILPGVIQLPSSGQPIIQAVDANTCGGYPKIGVIAAADLWRLGQARPGTKLHFTETSQSQALEMTETMEAQLRRLREFCLLMRKNAN